MEASPAFDPSRFVIAIPATRSDPTHTEESAVIKDCRSFTTTNSSPVKNSNTRVPVQIPASTGSTASRFDNTDGVRLEAPFDRILLDVPCSNTGVLRRRVDVRWRLTEEDFIRMPVQQAALVRRALPLLKPGGTLVYSTCSLEPEENERLVAQLLQAHPELLLKETRQTLPFRDGIDGAFAARFQLREA